MERRLAAIMAADVVGYPPTDASPLRHLAIRQRHLPQIVDEGVAPG